MTEPAGLPLKLHWGEDDSLEIEWDPDHPEALAMGVADWTEEQWLDALLRQACAVLEQRGEPCP